MWGLPKDGDEGGGANVEWWQLGLAAEGKSQAKNSPSWAFWAFFEDFLSETNAVGDLDWAGGVGIVARSGGAIGVGDRGAAIGGEGSCLDTSHIVFFIVVSR
ncbi:hypothetical protein Nepgr_019746 [Nepenthes gracilis]|uniref:Uncharacterized protein n=1 Tax=Nepenthes gracilis TaxID=150966 RepID=A0AAD3SVK4_NEPGR|nr:hypothetical protein Nepgr_019746 [Nepenthes gracilis]